MITLIYGCVPDDGHMYSLGCSAAMCSTSPTLTYSTQEQTFTDTNVSKQPDGSTVVSYKTELVQRITYRRPRSAVGV
jgi:hypothetical protein